MFDLPRVTAKFTTHTCKCAPPGLINELNTATTAVERRIEQPSAEIRRLIAAAKAVVETV